MINCKKFRKFVGIMCVLLLMFPTVASANIGNSKIVTGINKLLDDIGKVLIAIAIPAGTAVTAYCFIRRSASDEMDHKKWTNRINVAIVSTIGAIVAGVLISVLSGYFK